MNFCILNQHQHGTDGTQNTETSPMVQRCMIPEKPYDISTMLRHLRKRKTQLTLICLICITSSYSQTASRSYGQIEVKIVKEKKQKKIYSKVEIKSDFIGGDSTWVQSLEQTLNQSIEYRNGAKAGEYIISVDFIVDKEGNICEIRCISKPVGFGMEEHVLTAIRKKARWLPSPQGVPVRPYRTSSSAPPESN